MGQAGDDQRSAAAGRAECLRDDVRAQVADRAAPGGRVAPSGSARARLAATGSPAMIAVAPACRAPCTALRPIPPAPITTTVSPGRVPAVRTAAPQPVITPQLTRATARSGTAGSTLTQALWETTANCRNVPRPQNPPSPSVGNPRPRPR